MTRRATGGSPAPNPAAAQAAAPEAATSGWTGVVAAPLRRVRADLRDPLLRNGYALVLNVAVTAATGILYWILAARVYQAPDVGRSSAAISVMTLLASIGVLNFGGALSRFIPRAGEESKRLILIAYGCSAAAGAVVSLAYVLLYHLHLGLPSVLGSSLLPSVALGASVVAWCIFSLQDNVLTGLRQAVWTPLENGTYGVAKIALLLAFASVSQRFGIFASWIVPAAILTLPVNLLIFRRLVPRHTVSSAPRAVPLRMREVGRFVAGDYVGSLFARGTMYLLPVLVLARLGPQANAYFYIPFVTATTLDLVTIMLGNVLTVEGAHDQTRLRTLTASVVSRTLLMVVPTVALLFLFAGRFLSLYGAQYSVQGSAVLRLLLVAVLARAATTVHNALARVHRRVGEIALVNAAAFFAVLGLSWAFLGAGGIRGAALGYLIGQAAIAAAVTPRIVRLLRSGAPDAAENVARATEDPWEPELP